MGQPATGRHSSVLLTQTDRIVDGKIVESWSTWDVLSMLQQLGLAPAATQPTGAQSKNAGARVRLSPLAS